MQSIELHLFKAKVQFHVVVFSNHHFSRGKIFCDFFFAKWRSPSKYAVLLKLAALTKMDKNGTIRADILINCFFTSFLSPYKELSSCNIRFILAINFCGNRLDICNVNASFGVSKLHPEEPFFSI